jgi:membrane protein DedA with SNARE-associated domain
MNDTSPQNQAEPGKWSRFKKKALPIIGLVLAVSIIILVVFLYFQFPDFFKQENIEKLGYFGVFFISVILNATVIIPVSNMALIFALGAALPSPWVVGLLGGTGAAIGEMTGYLAGRSGRGLLSKNKVYVRVEGWVKKWGWIAIFVLSAVPLAFDVVGIIAGALKMPTWKFSLATWAGRTVTYTLVAYLGSIGLHALPFFN